MEKHLRRALEKFDLENSLLFDNNGDLRNDIPLDWHEDATRTKTLRVSDMVEAKIKDNDVLCTEVVLAKANGRCGKRCYKKRSDTDPSRFFWTCPTHGIEKLLSEPYK